MNNDSLSLKLFVILSKAYRVIMEQAVKDMKRHGLSETEFAMLELLYHKGKIPMQQMGEKLLITSGGITHTADKLENKGLLRRVACPSDRRVTYAEITEQGNRMFHEIFPAHQKVIESTMTGLTDEEKVEVIDLLKKLGLSAQNTQLLIRLHKRIAKAGVKLVDHCIGDFDQSNNQQEEESIFLRKYLKLKINDSKLTVDEYISNT